MIHEAIYALYPQVVVIRGEDAFDKNDNQVEYDQALVETKAAELQAQAQAKQDESLAKLSALGLTPEDLQRILGK